MSTVVAVCHLKIRRFGVFTNETTLNQKQNDIEVNSYMSLYLFFALCLVINQAVFFCLNCFSFCLPRAFKADCTVCCSLSKDLQVVKTLKVPQWKIAIVHMA